MICDMDGEPWSGQMARCMKVNGVKANKMVSDSLSKTVKLDLADGKMASNKIGLPIKNFRQSNRNFVNELLLLPNNKI